jgi:hypothetical protein
MISGNDFVRMMYEDDQSAKIAGPHKVKLGGKTEVELDPQVSPPHPSDTKPYTRDPSTTTDGNRTEKIDFPQQRGPTNPVERRLADMWSDSLEQQTRQAQKRQSGKYRDQ